MPVDALETAAIPTDVIAPDSDPAQGATVGGLTAETFGANPVPAQSDPVPQTPTTASQNGTHTTSYNLPGATGTGGKIVAAAEQLLGTDYVWGGNGPGGVDCSGLVAWAYKAAGINVPRISYQQANSGRRVGVGQLRPGDLVAVDNSARNPGADHIAIYLGNGMMIEAPKPGGVVQIVPVSYMGKGWYGVRMGW